MLQRLLQEKLKASQIPTITESFHFSFYSTNNYPATLNIRLPSEVFPFPRHHTSVPEPPSPFSPTTKTSASLPECAFTPHSTSFSQSDSEPVGSSIPSHAWPHITTLLTQNTANLLPPSPQDPFHRSRVHTLRLKDVVDDVSLEGVVVGLVYTAPEHSDRELELRDVRKRGKSSRKSGSDRDSFKYRGPQGDESGRKDRGCLAEAIRGVEKERVMEGVLELSGEGSGGKGGRVGFLVYRVD